MLKKPPIPMPPPAPLIPQMSLTKTSGSAVLASDKLRICMEKAQQSLHAVLESLSRCQSQKIQDLINTCKLVYAMLFGDFVVPKQSTLSRIFQTNQSKEKVIQKSEPFVKDCIFWLEYLFVLSNDAAYQKGIEQLKVETR
jgi:hypothetical protein